ncbi:MAG: UDP-N-acetylmuramate dehydrogenase [Deltaproteobacteria bacterium]|nr:UDP-N-acetylmuramate dehydrogenase [Deltaproteobacteria bacterium]
MLMSDFLQLTGMIKGEVRYSVPMSDYTSFRVGGQVDCLVYPADVPDLQNILSWGNQQGVRPFILGNGTNLLVRDGGIRGMAISLSRGFRQIEEAGRGPEETLIFAAAGGPLGNLVDFSSEKGLTGLEFAAGIPGTVGGAIYMNAGAFRGEMKEVLHSVKLMDSAGQVSEKESKALKFSYRAMELGKGEIILGGQFQLKEGNGQQIQAKIEENIRRRKAKQPWDLPSAGSVFKNPDGGPAGRFIEEAGLKGCRIGDAQVSEKHANFIVNRGKAKAKDILTLVEKVREKVFQEKGVWLKLEIQVVGED